jgi:hypothetical protein
MSAMPSKHILTTPSLPDPTALLLMAHALLKGHGAAAFGSVAAYTSAHHWLVLLTTSMATSCSKAHSKHK